MGSSLRVKLMTHREKRGNVYAIAFQLTINGVAKYEYTSYSVKENQFKEGLSDWVRKHPDAALINRNIELRRAVIMNNLLDAQAGITKNLTMHIARHSFADLPRKSQSERGETDIYVIQKAMGHSDIKTTQAYMDSLSDDKVNKEVGKMWK